MKKQNITLKMGLYLPLPTELIYLIISMVDNIDIRRYFNIYNKIDLTKYKFLNKILPKNCYYKWKKNEIQFNPFVKHIKSGEQLSLSLKEWFIGGSAFNIDNINKILGNYYEYNIVLEVPNHIEGEYRQNYGGPNDMMEINITQFEKCVFYDIGIYKLKKKNDEKNIENQHWFHLGNFDKNEYFTDYIEYKYARE